MELTEEQKAFKGNLNGEEEVAEPKAHVEALLSVQASKIKAWEESNNNNAVKERQVALQKEKANAERALKSARKKVFLCKAEVETACQTLKEAHKKAKK